MGVNGLQEMKAWIKRNAKHFKEGKYTVDDIVNLAIACGFSRDAIAQWETEIALRMNKAAA